MAEPKRNSILNKKDVAGARVLVVEARYYDDIADALLSGAVAALKAADVAYDVVTVPGALEIPSTIAIALYDEDEMPRYDAVVALGCVIRGDTIHFEIVSQESARALMDISVFNALPLGNGILTVNDESQAWARARVEEGDKGGDAARAALSVLAIKRRVGSHNQ